MERQKLLAGVSGISETGIMFKKNGEIFYRLAYKECDMSIYSNYDIEATEREFATFEDFLNHYANPYGKIKYFLS